MTQEDFFKRYTYTPSRDRIGGGGFGTVYKAKDNVLHREVAIKVSEVKTTADGKKTFSLKDEFEALAHVPKHPNIANYEEFYSYESPQGLFDYAVMQYYPDGNLSNAIKQGLTAEQKEDIATQLLEGIDFLHKHKVVHRDLKPGNILIVKDGSKVIPLITDFGLSKAAGVVDGSVFSNSFGAGTPRYSSPEQLQGNPLRLNTDLWSYGAILYELFTGEQLFTAGSGAANTAQADMEVYNKIVNGNVQSLGKIPEKWRKVAERCLVVDATKRAKDAKELFDFVRGDDDETEGPTRGPVTPPKDTSFPKPPHSGPAPLSPAPIGKPGPKKGLWIGIAAAAVVALLVFLLWPKNEPIPTDPDTQSYEACQTVADYRAYMRDYGRNALHYAEAMAFVDQYVADSMEQELQRKVIEEAKRVEDSVYMACITITACDNYLKAYPEGRFVTDVQNKIIELENNVPKNGLHKGHEYVDLGLPSGTLWATCNVGASKPEDYGHYYAWGEINPKDIYNWYTYQYSNGGTSWEDPNLTKYCSSSYYGDNGFIDNLTTLQSGDDPATNQWGSGWRTPSMAQWAELRNNTKHEWPTRNGVQGVLFTSKKNDQTLFLPAAGTRMDSGLEAAGFWGEYLSRSIFRDGSTCVWTLYFNLDDLGLHDGSRVYGYSVRPVRHK